jgi:hypothetical protein
MNKLITLILSVLGLCLVASSALGQEQESPWSLGAYYSFGQKDYAAVTANKIRTLENVLNLGFDLDVNGFAGVAMRGATLVGGSLTAKAEVARGVFAFLGLGVDGNITELRNLSLGIHGGINIPLGSTPPETRMVISELKF